MRKAALFVALAACGPSHSGPTPPAGPTAGTEPAQPVEPAVAVKPPEPTAPAGDDPFLWLEDVTGDKALEWVKAQNAVSQKELEAEPGFGPLRDRLLAIYDSTARIPYVAARGKKWLFNYW